MAETILQLQQKSDEELVSLSLIDKEIFAYLIERYEAKLKRYVNRLASFSQEEVEDLLQEIFIKVYKSLNDFDQKLKFSSWIYRIAHNQVISRFRYHQARPQAVSFDDDRAANLLSDSEIEVEVDQHLAGEELSRAMAELKPEQRDVLILRFFEGKSYDELSDILKKPSGTVASLIHVAKKELKRRLEKDMKNKR